MTWLAIFGYISLGFVLGVLALALFFHYWIGRDISSN